MAAGLSRQHDDFLGHKVFKDPIFCQISLPPILVKIADTKQFQRLRNIKQLSTVYHVYPGASHNRFEHSLGVCYLAKELLETLRQKQQKLFEELNVTPKDEMCVQIAALCHELGHGPMSHLYQDLFINRPTKPDPWKHKKASIKMFDYLIEQNRERLVDDFERWGLDLSADSADMIFIKELIYGGPLPGNEELRGRPSLHHRFLYEIVSNQQSGVDVDKMDYIARDCHALGMPHSFDWQRFMSFSMLIKDASGQVHICPREKEAADLYELFQVRDKLFRVAYQHKTKRAIEYMMAEALKKADPHIKLTGRHNGPRSVRMSEAITDMCALTELTDEIFWAIKYIPSSSLATPGETVAEAETREQDLKEARELLERVEKRDLYQCIGRTLPIDTEQEKVRKLLEEIRKSGLEDLTDNDTRQQSLDDERVKVREIMTEGKRQQHQPEETMPQQLVAMLNRSECPIQSTDILVDIITFSYGKGSKNPIDEVWFYRKDDAHDPQAVRVKREQVSEMLPTVFEECEIRLYLKKKVNTELKEELRSVFNEYCKRNGFRTPAGANGSHSS